MKEITAFIDTFLGAPLQLVIILLVFGLFLYWYLKVRPKELEQYTSLYNTIIQRCETSEQELRAERENFFKIMEDYRVQNERISALYDKALENSSRAIENNTSVICNYNAHMQVNNKALEAINDTLSQQVENLRDLEKMDAELSTSVHEAVALQQVIINSKRGES